MLSPSQIEYELDYWRKSNREKNDARQRKILDLWDFTGAPAVLEIGTGPYGGCLPFVKAKVKIGIDPMCMEYEEAGLLDRSFDWAAIPMPIEAVRRADPVDAVLCMNTLDHGDSNFSALASVARSLKPGGRFYLHVNLRTPEQLNEGHDHALRLEDLEAAAERAGLRPVRMKVYDHDPVEWAPYKSVVGIWER